MVQAAPLARRVLVVGATSAIAREVARLYAQRGAALFLVARDAQKLQSFFPGARTALLDINDTSRHAAVIREAAEFLGGIDVAFVSHGVLGVSEQWHDVAQADFVLRTNLISTAEFCLALVPAMQRGSTIAVVSSVAGDRGRYRSPLYTASKAGLDAFLSGLRARLYESGVNVLTIKPGFVDTPMVAHLKKNFLFAAPDGVARTIVRAIERRRMILYVPRYWRVIMFVTRLIPEILFRRIKL